MSVQIQLRRGTAAAWTAANPTLAVGEIGVETDTGKLKLGTGATAWNSLGYFGGVPSGSAGGDLGGTYPNPTVNDNSHAHDSTTVTTHSTAHAASAVTVADADGYLAAANVEAAIEEIIEKSVGLPLYNYSSTTTQPGMSSGDLRLNNATPSAASSVFIHETDLAGGTRAAWIEHWDDSSASPARGYVYLWCVNDPTKWATYYVSGAVTDNGTDYTVPVTHVNSSGAFTNGDNFRVLFVRTTNAVAPLGHLPIPVGAMVSAITNGAGSPSQREAATNDQNIVTASFADGSTTYLHWQGAMPTDWDGGTFTVKFRWIAPGTSTNTVRWQVEARSYGDAETLDQSWGTAQAVDDAHTATADQVLLSAATSAVTAAGTPAGGEWLALRIARLGGHANDNFAAAAELIAVELFYTRA